MPQLPLPNSHPSLSSMLASVLPSRDGTNGVVCRKKYAKLKVKFEKANRESESLIREELRIEDLSKRIQEQNE